MTEAEMWAAFLTAVGNENPDLVLPEAPCKISFYKLMGGSVSPKH